MMHILLDESLIQANNTLEKRDCLFAVVDLCRCKLIHWMVVRLEFACLEEWNRVLNKAHGGQLWQIFVVVEALFASLDVFFKIDYPPLDLFTAHKDGTDHKLVVLQIVKLFQVVDTLSMPGIASLFKLVPLFNRF